MPANTQAHHKQNKTTHTCKTSLARNHLFIVDKLAGGVFEEQCAFQAVFWNENLKSVLAHKQHIALLILHSRLEEQLNKRTNMIKIKSAGSYGGF